MFDEKLRFLREKAGLSQEQLANAIGVSKSTIGMYEQGKRMPKTKTVLKDIASYFNVSIDYLVDHTTADVAEEDYVRFGLRPVLKRRYPMLGKVACGEPIMNDEGYESYIEASGDIDADFCLKAQGDSMINARIFDGDVVFIRQQEMVENGEIAAVIVNDEEVTLKRFFYYQELNQVVLQAENPTYRPMVYTDEELDHIRVLGKAVAFTSLVR